MNRLTHRLGQSTPSRPFDFLLPRRLRQFSTTSRWSVEEDKSGKNPILEEYRAKVTENSPHERPKPPQRGDLAPSSIFMRLGTRGRPQSGFHPEYSPESSRNPMAMAARTDPEPLKRRLWERKMIIKAIRQRGRVSRATHLQRTERESLSKSHFLKTSVKKLGPLARQIAGKTLDDALLQMRFSKKKAAVEVHSFLEQARDEAIVKRGMGLENVTSDGQSEIVPKAIKIRLKDGKKHTITDTSSMYIDQAWVGRGPYGTDIDYRARGRAFRLRLPHTSLSVVLKEEATRVRQDKESKEKVANRKLWVQLPDRPVTAQHQYYAW